jgi:hypothetical protein
MVSRFSEKIMLKHNLTGAGSLRDLGQKPKFKGSSDTRSRMPRMAIRCVLYGVEGVEVEGLRGAHKRKRLGTDV